MSMRPPEIPRLWQWLALLPIATGLFAIGQVEGFGTALFAGLPGVLVLSTGVSLLLLPGDPRTTSYMALASLFGVIFSVPMLFAGFFEALLAALLFAASFMIAGRVGLRSEPVPDGVPLPEQDLGMQFKAGVDEALIGYFVGSASVPSGEVAVRMCEEALRLGEALDARGWAEHPETYHSRPTAPKDVESHSERIYGQDYERLHFDSGYEPHAELPGAATWMTHLRNHRTAAWMLRHSGPARPWLICIHGYRMGMPWLDFSLFAPKLLHHRFGLNVLMPILPLHGPRRIGPRSGDQFLDGDLLDLLFAESQALWDLRRWLAWLRANEPSPRIGVYGISLGGYNTALLSAYEEGLDFAVAGIPVVDLAAALWRYIPPQHRRYFAGHGLDENRYREILRAVSPLRVLPKIAREHLHVFAGTGDRLVPVTHALALARHWERPVTWYQGSHLSIRREREPRRVLEAAMLGAGWKIPNDDYGYIPRPSLIP